MSYFSIVWVEIENENPKKLHAAFSTKGFTLCGSKKGPEWKFKNLYDFKNGDKCEDCCQKVHSIYQGIV